MLDQKLLDYIKTNLAKGISKELIHQRLTQAGWQASLVDKALKEFPSFDKNKGAGTGFAAVDHLDLNENESKWKRINYKKIFSFLSALFVLSLLGLLVYAQSGSRERQQGVADFLDIISLEDEDTEFSFSTTKNMANALHEGIEKQIEREEGRDGYSLSLKKREAMIEEAKEKVELERLEREIEQKEELLAKEERRKELAELAEKGEFSFEKAKIVIGECSTNDDCSIEVLNILKGQSLSYTDLLDYNLTIKIDDIEKKKDEVDLYTLTVANDDVSFSCKTELSVAYGLIYLANINKRAMNKLFFYDYLGRVHNKDTITFICEKEEELLEYFHAKGFSKMVRAVENLNEDYTGQVCQDMNCLIEAAQDCKTSRYIYRYIDNSDWALPQIRTEQIDMYKAAHESECIIKGKTLEIEAQEKNDFECTVLSLNLTSLLKSVRNSGDVKFDYLKNWAINCKFCQIEKKQKYCRAFLKLEKENMEKVIFLLELQCLLLEKFQNNIFKK